MFFNTGPMVTRLGNYSPIRLLLKPLCTFWIYEVFQKWWHFGLNFKSAFLHISTLLSSFKTWFIVGILRFWNWFYVQMFWTFKLSFDVDILAFLGLVAVLATFSKNWAIFPQFSGHTVKVDQPVQAIGAISRCMVQNEPLNC